MSISSVKQSMPRQQPELSNQDAVKSREAAQTSQASQVKGRVAEKQAVVRSSQQSTKPNTRTGGQSTSAAGKTEQSSPAQDARATQKAQQSLQQPGKRVDVLG